MTLFKARPTATYVPRIPRLLDGKQAIVMLPESGLNAFRCSIRLIVEILASIAERPHGCVEVTCPGDVSVVILRIFPMVSDVEEEAAAPVGIGRIIRSHLVYRSSKTVEVHGRANRAHHDR